MVTLSIEMDECANRVDPDQMPQNASDLGLHSLYIMIRAQLFKASLA